MTVCPRCHKQLPQRQSFCTRCGMIQRSQIELLEAEDPIGELCNDKPRFIPRAPRTAFGWILVAVSTGLTLLVLILLYYWSTSFVEVCECSPIAILESSHWSDGSYQITITSISQESHLEAFQFYLLDERGRARQSGEIGLQNISGKWYGVDVTWTGRSGQRADENGGSYQDPDQARTRICELLRGYSPPGSRYTLGEGTLAVRFYDQDLDGRLTVGDTFAIEDHSVEPPADDDWSFELKYDLSGDIVGSVTLGD